MRFMFLTTRPTDIVDRLQDTRINVAVILCSRFTTDIGRGRDNGLLETIAEFLRERLVGNANAYAAILGNEVLCQIDGTIKNERCGLRFGLFQAIDQLPGHIGDVTDIALETGIAVDQADEGLGVITLFDVVDTLDCLRVGSVGSRHPCAWSRLPILCLLLLSSEFGGKVELDVFEVFLRHGEDIA